MDIKIEFQGSETDHRKPPAVLFNYDSVPSPEMIKAHILGHIGNYRDDISNYARSQAEITLNPRSGPDPIMGEGVATVHMDDETFQIRLYSNPDIPRGAPVRVSAYESPHHGAFGVLVDASGTANVWTVQMLDDRQAHYEREELADLSRFDTVEAGTPKVPAEFEIGELVSYQAWDNSIKAVRIDRRVYNGEGSWCYYAYDVSGGSSYFLGERTLSKLPRNLQNLQIIPRQG